MSMLELKSVLAKKFAECISNYTLKNSNELYIEVDSPATYDICSYIYQELGYPLISMFAADEKQLINSYAVYYVFVTGRRVCY